MNKLLVISLIFFILGITGCSRNNIKDNYSNQIIYDKEGFNKEGFNKEGFDKNGFDKNGFNNLKQNKKELEDKRLKSLVNSTPNINTVIASNLKKQEKDKYESDEEYLNRIKTLNIETSAIMDIDIKKEYNPNEKVYKIFFKTGGAPSIIGKFKYGKMNYLSNISDIPKDLSFNKLSLTYSYSSSKSNGLGSNAYGATVNVATYLRDEFVVFPNNLKEILEMKNVYSYKEYEYLDPLYYYIEFPVTKEKAKELDNQDLKLRVNIQLENVFDIYNAVWGKTATISSPREYYTDSYVFKVNIKEFVLFNKSTGEILFSYVDFSNKISN